MRQHCVGSQRETPPGKRRESRAFGARQRCVGAVWSRSIASRKAPPSRTVLQTLQDAWGSRKNKLSKCRVILREPQRPKNPLGARDIFRSLGLPQDDMNRLELCKLFFLRSLRFDSKQLTDAWPANIIAPRLSPRQARFSAILDLDKLLGWPVLCVWMSVVQSIMRCHMPPPSRLTRGKTRGAQP